MEHLDTAKLQALLNSPEGAALLQQLQKLSGEALQQAAQSAKAGDYARAQAILQPMMNDQIRTAADRLNKKLD